MQRYAITEARERVGADEAFSKCDYLCPECAGIVRVKRGAERTAHFFHLSEGSSCRNRFKNSLHSAVQAWLLQKLGAEACTEECFFPDICRIADVAYHARRVVFEVQLSPISVEEVLARTYDYYKVGWHVIWILHAHSFGRLEAAPFEGILGAIPHYFTDVGYCLGRLWDEGSFVRRGRRVWFGMPPIRKTIDELAVEELRMPVKGALVPTMNSLHELRLFRKNTWSCHLKGDLLEHVDEVCSLPRDLGLRRLWWNLYLWYLHFVA